MKKQWLLGALIVALAFDVVGIELATKPLTDRIDSAQVIQGLPLTDKQNATSGNGRKKEVWKIKGAELSRFEIIGNNPADADLISWDCAQYDKQGNKLSPLPPESLCHRLFVQVLGKFSKTPEWFAKNLISEAVEGRTTAGRQLADFSLETDGQYYYIRRSSRR